MSLSSLVPLEFHSSSWQLPQCPMVTSTLVPMDTLHSQTVRAQSRRLPALGGDQTVGALNYPALWFFCLSLPKHTHIHTHAHIHTYIYLPTYTHILMNTYTHIYTFGHLYTHIHTLTYTHSHTHPYTHSHNHA